MGVNCDRWTILKFFEVALVLVCLTFKRVTDDEASRVFLYLQRISREWSLLNNITWSRVGAALADATYGGYLIITFALFIGRLVGELPTERRISEYVMLGIGSILFIVLGSLSYAALDSVPQDLVDNAAIVGTFSLITAGFFLLDMGGPRAKKLPKEQPRSKRNSKSSEPKSVPQQAYDIEKQLEQAEKKHQEQTKDANGVKNGGVKEKRSMSGNGHAVLESETPKAPKGYQQMKDDFPRKYSIYGKDGVDGNETDDTEDIELPPRMESHSPVWSNIRKGHYGNYDVISSPLVVPSYKETEEIRPPSRPGDPGYVQYTAQHWGEPGSKTPRHSPTQV